MGRAGLGWGIVARLILGRPLRGIAFDTAVCGLVVFFAVSAYVAGQIGVPAFAVGLAAAVAVFFRRAHPTAVAVAVAALALVQVIAGWGPLAYDIAVLIALYSVVKYADRLRDGIVAGVVAVLGGVLAALQTPGAGPWWMGAFFYALIVGAVWLAGLNLRTRRLYVLSLEDRAATLEREREAQARAAVAEERTRIARELHDVVAHSMAVMIVQADGGAVHARPGSGHRPRGGQGGGGHRPGGAGGDAAAGRRTAGTHSDAAGPGGRARAPPARAGGAARVARPVPRRRAAGRLRRRRHAAAAAPRPGADRLPGGAGEPDQHAQARGRRRVGGADAGLERRRRRDPAPWTTGAAVRVDGPAPSGGHGLVGMRERVGVYDGSLAAGPTLAGGWRVRARLPLSPAAGTGEGSAAA